MLDRDICSLVVRYFDDATREVGRAPQLIIAAQQNLLSLVRRQFKSELTKGVSHEIEFVNYFFYMSDGLKGS